MPVFACQRCGQSSHLDDGAEPRCPHCGHPTTPPDPPEYVATEARTGTYPPTPAPPPPEEEAVVAEQVFVAGYEVLEELGRGGMGVVYKARQRNLNRLVALKMVLSGAHASRSELARFQTEARAAACLRHANIVQVYEVGEADGVPYFSLEYVDGGSLADRLHGRPQPVHFSAHLIETLARAVHHAHSHGIVHRDLKPANILLQRSEVRGQKSEGRGQKSDGGGERPAGAAKGGGPADLWPLTSDLWPKITDFGLAKWADDAPVTAPAYHTQSGAILGTPSYMAPEQAGGRTAAVGPATDVWALGAILYELLTGRPPFRAATPMDTLLRVLHDDPVRPTRLRPRLPRDLETVCLKCLEKDPARRYASASDLADDLHRFLNHEPVRARPVHAWERALHWLQQRRTPAALVLVSLVALLALSLVAAAYSVNSRLERALAEADRARTAEEEQKRQVQRLNAEARAALYFNRISLAQREWLSHNVPRADRVLDECPEALRSWEWHYLKRLCHADLATLRGHSAPVLALAFSPDGRTLASAGVDESVRLWHPLTGRAAALKGHTSSVRCVAFSPDGQTLASAGDDGTVRLWDVPSAKPLFTLTGHAGKVACVAFSPDGQTLASAGDDRAVRLWDLRTRKERFALAGHTDRVTALAFHQGGRRLASAGNDGTPRVWDLELRKQALSLRGHRRGVTALAFSPGGRHLASSSLDRTVRVWDAATGDEVFILAGHPAPVTGVAFSPDGTRLATSGRSVTVWDAATGDEVFTLRGHAGPVAGVAFRPDGLFLASAGQDRTVRLWDARAGQERRPLPGPPRGTYDLAFRPDGRVVALAGVDHDVRLREVATGREVRRLRGHAQPVMSVAFHPAGDRVAAADTANRVLVWDASTGKVLLNIERGGRLLAFSPDGRTLAATTTATDPGGRVTGFVVLRDVGSGKEVGSLRAGQAALGSLAFSPGGDRLASASLDGTAILWEVATAQPALRLTTDRPGGQFASVSFSPGGRRLVTCAGAYGRPSPVKVWDAATGTELLTLRGHEGEVHDAVFTPDGRRVVTAGVDRTLKVWDAATGTELLTLRGHRHWVLRAAVSPDGLRLLSTARDRAVLVWEAAPHPPDALARSEARALADSLFEKLPLKSDVLAHLKADRSLPEPVRKLALEEASRRTQTADELNTASWVVVRFPGPDARACRRALRRAEAAVAREPGNGSYLNTLGVACYRAGEHQRALEVLKRSDAINSRRPGGRAPADVAFLALASQALGQVKEARQYRDQLRALLKEPRHAKDVETQAFAREVEKDVPGER